MIQQAHYTPEEAIALNKRMPLSKRCGHVAGEMWLCHEEKRMLFMPSSMVIEEVMNIHNIHYRSAAHEMLFKAETGPPTYYPTDEFSLLCFRCMDFSKMTDNICELPNRLSVDYSIKKLGRRTFS